MIRVIVIPFLFIIFIYSIKSSAVPKKNRPAFPLEPVAAVIKAFDKHDIVALGEGTHNNEQAHRFRTELINSPEFPKKVNDIVVEFGSSRYQDTIDRFVSGEDIPYQELRKVWMNTTQIHEIWDVPIYESFFRSIREVNQKLPESQKLRVILGDPPIDWSKITTGEDYTSARKRTDRKKYPVKIIQREVLSKGRKALVIYGDNHFMRKNIYWDYKNKEKQTVKKDERASTIVTLLEDNGATVFSIWTNAGDDIAHLQKDINSWKIPSLTYLKNTDLGAKSFALFYGGSRWAPDEDGKVIEIKLDPLRSSSMQEQYDAILYVGQKTSITKSQIPVKLCEDDDYMKVRMGRMALLNIGEHLKKYCDETIW